jgi:hypothetical protein
MRVRVLQGVSQLDSMKEMTSTRQLLRAVSVGYSQWQDKNFGKCPTQSI